MTPIRDPADGTRRSITVAVERLKKDLVSLSPIQRSVVECRLIQEPPMTLAKVGLQVGRTRERIRQIQLDLALRIARAIGEDASVVASVLRGELPPIAKKQSLDQLVKANLGKRTGLPQRLFRKAVIDELGYSQQEGLYVNGQARSFIAEIRRRAPGLADDAGLIDKSTLLEAVAGERWHRHWPLLQPLTGLHAFNGFLSLRDTDRARAKAALLSVGRPATPQEVAGAGGPDARQAVKALATFPSVVRADKNHWALKEWVGEEYKGITEAITLRIEECGGVATVERLLRELPEKFGVTEPSVRAYMRTRKFAIQDGRIRLASPAAIELNPLDEAIHGRNTDGSPYVSFTAEPQHLAGQGLRGMPPEVVNALGCEPDGRTLARIENLPGCPPLSVHWNLGSNTGTHLGGIGDALRALGIRAGQTVRVTLKGPGVVTISKHGDLDRTLDVQ